MVVVRSDPARVRGYTHVCKTKHRSSSCSPGSGLFRACIRVASRPLSRPGDVPLLNEQKGAAPGALNENGGCEDGQGSLSVASASSLSLRFRSRVGEVITTARSPRRNKIEREARQSEAARALLRTKVATVVWGVRDSSVVAPPVTCLALNVRVCLLWDELLGGGPHRGCLYLCCSFECQDVCCWVAFVVL